MARLVKRYLVGISYKDGSADNDLIRGFSAACEKAEKASLSSDVIESSVWLNWTPIRDYEKGVVVKEHNGTPAY